MAFGDAPVLGFGDRVSPGIQEMANTVVRADVEALTHLLNGTEPQNPGYYLRSAMQRWRGSIPRARGGNERLNLFIWLSDNLLQAMGIDDDHGYHAELAASLKRLDDQGQLAAYTPEMLRRRVGEIVQSGVAPRASRGQGGRINWPDGQISGYDLTPGAPVAHVGAGGDTEAAAPTTAAPGQPAAPTEGAASTAPADFQDVTIGGGTEFEELFNELMGQLGEERQARADVGLRRLDQEQREREFRSGLGLDILDYLQGQQEFGAATDLDLLSTLGALGGQRAGTLGDLLSTMQSGRLAGGGLGLDLLNVLGNQEAQQTGLGIDLMQQLTGERLARGGLGADLFSRFATERAGRGALAESVFNNLLALERDARAQPAGIVDLLALGQQFGTTQPLSQVGSEALTEFGYRPGAFSGELQDELRNFIQPDARMSALAERLLGFLDPDPRAAGLATDLQQRIFQGPDQELVSAIRGATQPLASEDFIARAIFGTTQETPEMRALIDRLMTRDGGQQSALVEQLLALMNEQPSDLADVISDYAQGAIPRGRVGNAYVDPTTGNVSAFVVLPSGGAEMVNLGNVRDFSRSLATDPNQLLRQQGATGPFTLPAGDVGRVLDELQAQSDQFRRSLELLPEGDRPQLLENRRLEQIRRRQREQDLANRFRTANPDQRQQIIQDIAGLEPILF